MANCIWLRAATLVIFASGLLLGCKASQPSHTAGTTGEAPHPPSLSSAGVIAGQVWYVHAVRDRPVPVTVSRQLFMQFDQEASKLSGSDGCNRYFAEAMLDGKGSLEIGQIASTKKYCQDTLTPVDFHEALEAVRNYRLTQGALLLMNAEDRVQLELRGSPAAQP